MVSGTLRSDAMMATVSSLPFTLFTLPAGAIADMVDRKKLPSSGWRVNAQCLTGRGDA